MKPRKNDIILAITVIIFSIAIFVGYNYLYNNGGDTVVVTVDGKEYARYPLNKDSTHTIKTTKGNKTSFNTLQIKKGAASITDADCPDKLCVHQKEISHKGETLVCLPHKLIVSISSSSKSNEELDGVAR